jgi:hypothetical protein
MIETSAHLVDHVIPEVPVRQMGAPPAVGSSFPWPLRLLFASRPDALGRCLAVIVRAIQTDLARRAGLTAGSGARTGVVTLIQRSRACRLGAASHTRPRPICSPNADQHAATGPPALTSHRLPENRFPASGNGPSVRERFARSSRARQ